jgi:hypothetical protein
MNLKHVGMAALLLVTILAGYFALRTGSLKSDPASSMATFFLMQVHCPMRQHVPADNLHNLHTSLPF